MPRLAEPVGPEGGAVADFARDLRALRDSAGAGAPGVDEVCEREGVARSTVYAALRGTRLPRREVVAALARAWGGDEAEWLARRGAVEEGLARSAVSVGSFAVPPSGGLFTQDLPIIRDAAVGRKRYRPGQVLTREGDQASHVLLLEKGVVKVSRIGPDGTTRLLGYRGPGELLGEIAAIDGGVQESTAIAEGDVETMHVPVTRFLQLLKDHPGITHAILKSVTRRMRLAEESAALTKSLRVIHTLRAVGRAHGVPENDGFLLVSFSLSLAELAAMAQVSLVTAHRVVSDLRQRGLVRFRQGKVWIAPELLLET